MKKLLYTSIVTALLATGCGSLNAPNHPSGLPLLYHNAHYDFTFYLPASWQGYSVLVEQWQGTSYLPGKDTTAVTAQGPMIVLRHPQWRAGDRYQDIPIMVFTRSQWDSDQNGRFGIGAGGFDEEMWHNEKYVFGMSSRYNGADSVKGWKEVADIVERNRAANKMPRLYPSGGGIHEAARAGDLEKVKALLKDNPDLVFSKDNLDETPLHYAAIFGGKGVAELLLANKAKVNAKDINGETPLHWAAYSGHKDVAELLLANKAEVNAKAIHGLMPLHLAARLGHKGVAELLLANKAEVNAKAIHGLTALHFAVFDGRKEVVELLLANKAKVNAKDANGWTPLHWAAASGSTHAAELLRQHGGHK
jgi:hypothetical protein